MNDSSSPEGPRPNERAADLVFTASVVGVLVLSAALLAVLPGLGSILLLSALVAYALLPLVDRLALGPRTRPLAILLVGVVGVGLGVLGVWALTPLVVAELTELPEALRETARMLLDDLERLRATLPRALGRSVERGVEAVQEWALEGGRTAGVASEVASRVATSLTSFTSALLFIPFFVFVMLRSQPVVARGLRHLIPPRWCERFTWRMEQADKALAGFVRGQLLVALIMGVLYGLAFWLIGLPLAVPLGVVAGLGELVPFLGGAVVLVLGLLLALVEGSALTALWVVLAFLLLQTLESALISPWIVGKGAHLGPGPVVFSVVLGGELFGLVGLLLAVPVAALVKVALGAALEAWRGSDFFRARSRG